MSRSSAADLPFLRPPPDNPMQRRWWLQEVRSVWVYQWGRECQACRRHMRKGTETVCRFDSEVSPFDLNNLQVICRACRDAEADLFRSQRVLVSGGRDYAEWWRVWTELDRLHAICRIDVLIQGGARGADRFAAHWATVRGVWFRTFLAEWRARGKGAGSVRNQRMLDEMVPDLAVLFPGGPGTANMKQAARRSGVAIHEVK